MTATERTFGRFRLLRELGRGAHGTVHEAEDGELGRRVALKVFPVFTGTGEDPAAERFRREVAALSRVDSPGVCRIYATGSEGGSRWIAMRLVEGRTLAESLGSRPGPAPRNEDPEPPATRVDHDGILAAVAAAARALDDVHRAGFVHGDLKPGNLMLPADGGCVLVDFGVAWAETDAAGARGGTLPYLSPERIRGGGGRPSDLWALGVVLFEALTRSLPFAGPSEEALTAAILTEDPPDPRDLVPGLSRDLSAVVGRCLRKDPALRFGTARELADEIDRVLRGEPVQTRRPTAAGRIWRSARRHPALTFLVVFLPVSLATLLALVLWTRVDEARLLGLASVAEREARARSAEAAGHLEDFLALADVQRFADLDRRAQRLWPPRPEILPELDRWLEDAIPLTARLEERRAELARLRARARRNSTVIETSRAPALARETEEVRAAIAVLAARVESAGDDPRAVARLEAAAAAAERMLEALGLEASAVEAWLYDDAGLTLQDQVLSRIVAGLEQLASDDPHGTSIAGIRRRISAARALGEDLDAAARQAWDRARASIADPSECPVYGGLRLAPQRGLVPLGRDLASGLWEFHHEASGTRPSQDARGRWPVGEETGLVLVLVPGGRATLGARLPGEGHPTGSPHVEEDAEILEGPVHAIDFAPYFLSKYEMTQGQWLRATGRNPSAVAPPRSGSGEPVDLTHPVEGVSWSEAVEVLWRLGLELPTEAQWERAARGGTTGPRWTGRDLRSLAGAVNAADLSRTARSATAQAPEWFDDGFADHSPVGAFRPNPFGLHDVFGNVWEWCRDAYDTYAGAVFQEGDGELLGPSASLRVYRGGGASTPLPVLRSAKRNAAPPTSRLIDLGLRPARRVE